MFTDHGTFIIGFSVSKDHIGIAPEQKAVDHFRDKLKEFNISNSKMLFRYRWDEEFNLDLLKEIIVYNIKDKKDVKTFWRK